VDLSTSFQTLGISLGLGLLVGIQRERVDAPLAGVRTFALITLLGTLTGMLSVTLGPWVVFAGYLGVTATVAMGNVLSLKQPRADTGITTEIAILIMYVIGAYLVLGHRPVAVVLGGVVAVLLQAKPILHGFVKRLGETDMRVMMQFVLLTLVILPILPDRAYGPFEVLNPREIWRMVVLVVGVSLCGYVALKIYGARAGIVLGGIIGGVISSTATTVSYARRTSGSKGQIGTATLVILIATTILYARVLVLVSVVAPREIARVGPPAAMMLIVSFLECAAFGWAHRRLETEVPAQENPTELKAALVFGALYAIVLIAVAAARHYFGDRGILVAAGISGLTDMDAITLGTARLLASGAVSPGIAWRAILLASIANLAFKSGLVAWLGGKQLFRRIAALFAIQIAAGLAILVFWPG
jgi:uncharacterized membrane protein (DUF4010 family)